jgi:hypothetical protein
MARMGWMRVAVWIVVAGCGGAVSGGQGAGIGPDAGTTPASDAGTTAASDAAVPRGQDAQPEGGTVVGTCTTEGGCPANATCVFAIGSCSAKGVCYENQSFGCGSREYMCGCNGVTVTAGCGTFGGATGPTTGAPSQTNGQAPDYCSEAGMGGPPDAAVVTAPDASACSAACESTCVGDPVCITNCGC